MTGASVPILVTYPRMNIAAKVLLAFALATSAEAQISPCASVSGPVGYLTLRWNWFSAYATTVEFVPYGGGIAAMVVVIGAGPPHPLSTSAPSSSCPPRDIKILGWAWSPAFVANRDMVGLAGTLNGAIWNSPLVKLHQTEPAGIYMPAAPVLLSATLNNRLGVQIWRERQGWQPVNLTAYLIAPASGSW